LFKLKNIFIFKFKIYNKYKYKYILMKELFYYSIFAIILYFVFSSVFENFNLEQENFDPSLVPVSSIVTLAKVAQKLVNGNGTLTNPGNLQIGTSSSAPGNLTVTGSATVTGNTTVTGIVTVSGNIVTGEITNGKIQIGSWGGGPTLYANDSAKPLAIHNDGTGKNVQIGFPGYSNSLTVTGGLKVIGKLSEKNLNDRDLSAQIDNIRIGANIVSNNDTNANLLIGSANKKVQIWSSGLDVDNGLKVDGSATVKGDINARTDGYDTRIGRVWTAPGIYAEGTKNLEIGAGSNNVFIGAADNTTKQNLTVTGKLKVDGSPKGLSIENYSNDHPSSQTIEFGDGKGCKLRFQQNKDKPILDIYDNQQVHIHGNLFVSGNITVTGNIASNLFYILDGCSWRSSWQGWQWDGQTIGGLIRQFNACNAAGGKTCTWDRRDQNGNGFDPHGNIGKLLTVNWKCGLNGPRKSQNFGDGDAVKLSCP
jgi:hypothetical protein